MENYDFVESNLRSTKRHLLEMKKCFKFEILCLNFIQKAIKIRNKKVIKSGYHELNLALLKLKQDPLEKNASSYFDLTNWTITLTK